jgi:hypothetical protein
MAKHGKGNDIADVIEAGFVVIVFLWLAWILFSKQIIAWLTNLVTSIVNAIISFFVFILMLGIGFAIAWYLVERSIIPSGWGLIIAIALFFIIGYLQLATIGLVLIVIDMGALVAFVLKFIDQAQYNGLGGGFLRQ